MQFIDLKAQYQAYKSDIDAAMAEVVSSCGFVNGPKVQAAEEQLAAFVGTRRAVGVSSGTDALLAVLMAWGVGPGDEVITTPFTFIASAEVIALTGARPVFVDVDAETLNMNPAKIEEAITSRTKAIMPVSLYGQCADFDAINAIAKKHGVKVLEDGCQSMGAQYKGKRSGALADAGTTSFFPAKPLGCYGDGGMLFTDSDDLADAAKILKEHGQPARYQHDRLGFNGRLDAIQAAVLLAKLPRFDEEIEARQKVAQRYDAGLKDVARTPLIREGNLSVYAQYTLRIPQRDQVATKVNEAGVPTAVHYPIGLHQQKAFEGLGYKEGDFPECEKAASEVVSLPMHPFLQPEEQDQVIQAVRSALESV